MFLANEGHEVRLAVAVEVGHWNMDRSMPVIEYLLLEFGMIPIGCVVLQENDFTRCMQTENGHNQVQLAGSTKVGGLHVGYAAHLVEQRMGREGPVFIAAQPHDLAARAIGRRKTT